MKGITYHEALDEALCFGWIDGVKKRVDDLSYCHRFTPRRPRSYWSLVNIEKAKALIKNGRMMPAGLEAFKTHDPAKASYSYEQRNVELDAVSLERLKQCQGGWDFLQSQPPGYRRSAVHWVMSAKREETKERRFRTLLEACQKGARVPALTGAAK